MEANAIFKPQNVSEIIQSLTLDKNLELNQVIAMELTDRIKKSKKECG